jgi:hypothetical protein
MSSEPRHLSTAPLQDEEFFVGYLPRAPRGIRARTRWMVGLMVLLATLAAAISARAFRSPGDGAWSDEVGEFTGQITEHPCAALRVVAEGGVQVHILVQTGKFGAAERVRGLDGRTVRIRGTLLSRDGRRVIEIGDGPGDLAEVPAPTPPAVKREDLGRVSLAGEIIDPKCFIGAMKPGDGPAHRACAVRCIEGGIPPMLAVPGANPADGFSYYLLVDRDASPINRRVLPFVAEPVQVSGQAVLMDDLPVLYVDNDPAAIRRR